MDSIFKAQTSQYNGLDLQAAIVTDAYQAVSFTVLNDVFKEPTDPSMYLLHSWFYIMLMPFYWVFQSTLSQVSKVKFLCFIIKVISSLPLPTGEKAVIKFRADHPFYFIVFYSGEELVSGMYFGK